MAVTRLAHDLEGGLGFEQTLQAIAKNGVIVGDDDTDAVLVVVVMHARQF